MQLNFYKQISSTQQQLLKAPKVGVCLYTHYQTHGIGSRGHAWECVKSGLYFSFCIHKCALPHDLSLQSASIYFGQIFKDSLLKFTKQKIFLKWPNDLYLGDQKIGGVMVSVKNELLIIGIGLNYFDDKFGALQKRLNSKKLLQKFFKDLFKLKSAKQGKTAFFKGLDPIKSKILAQHFAHQKGYNFLKCNASWVRVFKKFKLEFKSDFSFHHNDRVLDLKGAKLCKDGAVCVSGQRFYSLR